MVARNRAILDSQRGAEESIVPKSHQIVAISRPSEIEDPSDISKEANAVADADFTHHTPTSPRYDRVCGRDRRDTHIEQRGAGGGGRQAKDVIGALYLKSAL